jgi:hypothetical protein
VAGDKTTTNTLPATKVNLVVPSMWPDDLGIELAGAHGRVAALVHGGRPVQATVVADGAHARSVRWRRT